MLKPGASGVTLRKVVLAGLEHAGCRTAWAVPRGEAPGSSAQEYDDVKIGYDHNADNDILDAGDDIQVSDGFGSNVTTLSHDHAGNLVDDGVYSYVYDAWNRLRKVNRVAAGDTTTIATYAYLADTRRASKVVEHCGAEAVANDGGDTTLHFYYGGVVGLNDMPVPAGSIGNPTLPVRWNVFEERNGSNQAVRQYAWGTRYVDEILFMDVNGDAAAGSDCDPDVSDPNDSVSDKRYFYHQDRDRNVVALTEYAPGAGSNGRVVERYAYTPYGEFLVLRGVSGDGELVSVRAASTVGNSKAHHGRALDNERTSYQDRLLELSVNMGLYRMNTLAPRSDGQGCLLNSRTSMPCVRCSLPSGGRRSRCRHVHD